MRGIFLSLISLCLSHYCSSQVKQNRYELVLTNVNVVDIANNKVIPDQLIAISDNTIKAIDQANRVNIYKADRYVNGSGKYVLPGLWDMHVHFRGGDSLIAANKKLLPIFLAYGITTVRECGGDLTPAVLEWKHQIEKGNLAGPRIYTSGPKIDGPKAFWAGSLEVETPTQVSLALDSLKKLEVDFVKIYDSKISRETYLETLVQAQSRGMKTSGHMPFTVNLTEGVERGLDALEHMFNILKACSAKEDSLTKFLQERVRTGKPIGFYAALPLFYESYDENKAKELFRYLARNNFSVVPTLFVVKTSIVELKNNDHATDSFLSYIDPKIQATYQGRLKSAKAQTDETNEFLKRFMLKSNAMVPQMYAAGVNILAGSDCGASNSFVYPGVSLHEELKLMVASGLTPAQALQTATRNAAKFMGAEHIHGSIQEGRSSDIVVLDANPLSDINAIGKINMVISGGSLYSQSDLEKLLKSVKQ